MLHVPDKQKQEANRPCPGPDQEAKKGSSLDQLLNAWLSRFSFGISPIALGQAYADWAQHLLLSPDKQTELLTKAQSKWARYLGFCLRACTEPECPGCIDPLPQDKRFSADDWQ
ncbi:MAG: poly-beta-hydroxybutyrate polymerase N-terminal domain-containing protein, partial [Oricola sp.]|nr:poly-beta-hydroxybutyrate polymerase N-terminal domain-containing protein [Oricola sp.]